MTYLSLYISLSIYINICTYVYVFLVLVFRRFCGSAAHGQAYTSLERSFSLLNHFFQVQVLPKRFQRRTLSHLTHASRVRRRRCSVGSYGIFARTLHIDRFASHHITSHHATLCCVLCGQWWSLRHARSARLHGSRSCRES